MSLLVRCPGSGIQMYTNMVFWTAVKVYIPFIYASLLCGILTIKVKINGIHYSLTNTPTDESSNEVASVQT